ncbi:MAG: response regulator [Nitrospiraceae bacterium]|nr:response regulator [Nitrospiraceae bacterium]
MFLYFGTGAALLIFATWFIMVFGLPYSGYKGSWQIYKSEAYKSLNLLADIKQHELEHFIDEHFVSSKNIATSKTVRQHALSLLQDADHPAESEEKRTALKIMHILNTPDEHPDISLLNYNKLTILLSASGLKKGSLPKYADRLKEFKSDFTKQEIIFFKDKNESLHALFITPVYGPDNTEQQNRIFALLAVETDVTKWFDTLLKQRAEMGRTGEVILLTESRLLLAGIKQPLPDGTRPKPLEYRLMTKPAQYAVLGHQGIVSGKDYRGVKVLSAVRFIRFGTSSGIGVVVKMDRDEVFEPIWSGLKYLAAISIGLLLLFIGLTHTASRWLSAPLEKLSDTAKKISEGDLGARAQISGKYEIDVLGNAFNSMAEKVQQWNRELETEVEKRTFALLDATTKLNASKERLSLALSAGHIGMYDANLQTGEVHINNEYAKILDYNSSDELSESVENWKEKLHPLDRDSAIEVFNAFIAGEIPVYATEFRLRSKNNDWVWILSAGKITEYDSNGKPARMLGTHINITERKKTETILLEREEKYRNLSDRFNTLLEANPDVVMVLSPEMNVVWANKAASDIFGETMNEIVSKKCCDLWYKGGAACTDCFAKKSLETGSLEDYTIESHDSRIWDIRSVAIPNPAGKTENVMIFARDMTERKKLEEQLLQAQKMEAVGQLAGGIAHDFNNILTGIIGYASLLQIKAPDNGGIKSDIVHIIQAAERAAEMTKNLLTFSRKQIFNYYTVNLNEIISRTMKIASRLISEDIEIKAEFKRDPLNITADDSQLQQVLLNLITNARDAMPHGGRLLVTTDLAEFDEEFVRIHGIGSPGSYVVWSVSDTGTGMDESTRKKIFEPFFTTKEMGKGTGLGLSMVYGIIKQHKGHINVYSSPGEGTTFRIYLPSAAGKSVSHETTARERTMPFGRGETLLVAEDDYALRGMAESLLTEFGYNVILAENGEDAIEKFILNKDSIDALLFDVTMPRMGGVQAYIEISRIKPDIKVLFYTGYAKDLLSEKNYPFDMSKIIQKPVAPHELLTKLRDMLDAN